MSESRARQPVVFLSHGNSPSSVILDQEESCTAERKCVEFLGGFREALGVDDVPPKALLVISSYNWQNNFRVTCRKSNTLFHDILGAPRIDYQTDWSPDGAPALAHLTKDLLQSAGLSCTLDYYRGLDHGTFAPLILAFPNAAIPGEGFCLELNSILFYIFQIHTPVCY